MAPFSAWLSSRLRAGYVSPGEALLTMLPAAAGSWTAAFPRVCGPAARLAQESSPSAKVGEMANDFSLSCFPSQSTQVPLKAPDLTLTLSAEVVLRLLLESQPRSSQALSLRLPPRYTIVQNITHSRLPHPIAVDPLDPSRFITEEDRVSQAA